VSVTHRTDPEAVACVMVLPDHRQPVVLPMGTVTPDRRRINRRRPGRKPGIGSRRRLEICEPVITIEANTGVPVDVLKAVALGIPPA
jgi:hypothetical protein